LALAQGLAIGALWVYTTIPSLLGWVIDLRIPPWFVAFICVATWLICGLAAVVPGRRAARLEPAVALRWE
jgi:ABC-type lipoprotein release transport system permease subunit